MKYDIQFYYYVSPEQEVTYFISCKTIGSLSVSYFKLTSHDCILEKVYNMVDIIASEQGIRKLLPTNPQFALFKQAFGICKNNRLYNKADSQQLVDNIAMAI